MGLGPLEALLRSQALWLRQDMLSFSSSSLLLGPWLWTWGVAQGPTTELPVRVGPQGQVIVAG